MQLLKSHAFTIVNMQKSPDLYDRMHLFCFTDSDFYFLGTAQRECVGVGGCLSQCLSVCLITLCVCVCVCVF